MSTPEPGKRDVTTLLEGASKGDREALRELLPLVYEELRSRAERHMRKERAGHTLQPTALVHEAYARLVDHKQADWKNRGHFLALASRTMRQILVDHARKRNAEIRGGDRKRVHLDDDVAMEQESEVDLEALDLALEELAAQDERLSEIVVMRFFGGMTLEEIGAVLDVSTRTVKRDWKVAKLLLFETLSKRDG